MCGYIINGKPTTKRKGIINTQSVTRLKGGDIQELQTSSSDAENVLAQKLGTGMWVQILIIL